MDSVNDEEIMGYKLMIKGREKYLCSSCCGEFQRMFFAPEEYLFKSEISKNGKKYRCRICKERIGCRSISKE